jgi:hypothetical protein
MRPSIIQRRPAAYVDKAAVGTVKVAFKPFLCQDYPERSGAVHWPQAAW